MGPGPSITHYYTHLLPSKVIISEARTGHSTSVLVPCSCFGFRPPIPPKRSQQPPTFQPLSIVAKRSPISNTAAHLFAQLTVLSQPPNRLPYNAFQMGQTPLKLFLFLLVSGPYRRHGSFTHPSPQPKRHLDRFFHFCRAHDCNRRTDRPTDHATRSVTIDRIHVRSTAMQPNNTAF